MLNKLLNNLVEILYFHHLFGGVEKGVQIKFQILFHRYSQLIRQIVNLPSYKLDRYFYHEFQKKNVFCIENISI